METRLLRNKVFNRSKRRFYLDIEVLIDRVKSSAQRQIVLEFDHHVLADQRLEEGVKQHFKLRPASKFGDFFQIFQTFSSNQRKKTLLVGVICPVLPSIMICCNFER
jgi:hypothetical protein